MAIVKPDMSGPAGNDEPKKTPRKSPARAAGAKKNAAAPPVATTESAPTAPTPRKAVAAADPEMVILDPTHEEIALRAYELYLARGRRDGHSDGDWVRAERELQAERARHRLALRQPATRSTTES